MTSEPLCNKDLASVRQICMEIIYTVVPSKTTEPIFEEITQGLSAQAEKSKQFLSTCGFLPNYMWEKLGCQKAAFRNRNIPALGMKYIPGMNMSTILNGGRSAKVFINYGTRGPDGSLLLPEKGDTFFISNGPSVTEHVGVFRYRDGNKWYTADAGQQLGIKGEESRQCSKMKERTWSNGALDGRKLVGWISVEKIQPLLTLEPDLDGTEGWRDNPYI